MKKFWHIWVPKHNKIFGNKTLHSFEEAVTCAMQISESNYGMKTIIMESVGGFQNIVKESEVKIMEIED